MTLPPHLQHLFVAALSSRLDEPEQQMRAAIQRLMVAAPGPVTAEAAGAALGLDPEAARALVRRLADKRVLVLDAEGQPRFAYPVSSQPTAHRVRLGDGRELYAMCAIDALGCRFTFGTPVTVASACADCGAPIHIAVSGAAEIAATPATAWALHLDLNQYPDWATDT